MLQIVIPSRELFDERTQEFIQSKEYTIQLEHSLVSISKWESKYKKPFLSKDSKTVEETMYYVKCMTITQNIPDNVYSYLTNDNLNSINAYIQDSMTATTFSDNSRRSSREIITSELIYYWMISQNIPMECQRWHLNRLLTLIRICGIKNGDSKPMNTRDLISRNSALNAMRRKQLNSKG